MEEIIKELGQFGIAGLFFVMWFFEKRDKHVAKDAAENYASMAKRAADNNDIMFELVQTNTKAMTALTDQIGKLSFIIDRKMTGKVGQHVD